MGSSTIMAAHLKDPDAEKAEVYREFYLTLVHEGAYKIFGANILKISYGEEAGDTSAMDPIPSEIFMSEAEAIQRFKAIIAEKNLDGFVDA